MRIIGMEPYYGGSHKLFIDGLAARSSHDWTVLTMKPRKWKWRMLHAGAKFAEEANALLREEKDEAESGNHGAALENCVFFSTDMMNVAEFKGLLAPEFSYIPLVFYFHENQLTYPIEHPKDGDRMFGWINILSAFAADEVWFNSRYHLDAFIEACQRFLRKTPDARPLHMTELIAAKAHVVPQAVERFPARGGERRPGPLRILWAARWEYDKNPAFFFEALEILDKMEVDFRISVVGDKAERAGEPFLSAEKRFAERIDTWGYLPDREDYIRALTDADVAVSTADHEFFGVALGEAVSAGCFPLAPKRLAYPELLDAAAGENDEFFHDGTLAGLAERLAELAENLGRNGTVWHGDSSRGIRAVERFNWNRVVAEVDYKLEQLAASRIQISSATTFKSG